MPVPGYPVFFDSLPVSLASPDALRGSGRLSPSEDNSAPSVPTSPVGSAHSLDPSFMVPGRDPPRQSLPNEDGYRTGCGVGTAPAFRVSEEGSTTEGAQASSGSPAFRVAGPINSALREGVAAAEGSDSTVHCWSSGGALELPTSRSPLHSDVSVHRDASSAGGLSGSSGDSRHHPHVPVEGTLSSLSSVSHAPADYQASSPSRKALGLDEGSRFPTSPCSSTKVSVWEPTTLCVGPRLCSPSDGASTCFSPSSSPTVGTEEDASEASHAVNKESQASVVCPCPTLLQPTPRAPEEKAATVLAALLQDTLTPKTLRVLVVGCAGRVGRLVFKRLLQIEKHDKRRWLHVTGLARDASTRTQLLKEDPDICREDVIVCDIRDAVAVRDVFGLPRVSLAPGSSSSSSRGEVLSSPAAPSRKTHQERLYRGAWLRYQEARAHVERALLDARSDSPEVRLSIAARFKSQLRDVEQRLLSVQPAESLFDAVIICTSSRLAPVIRRSGNLSYQGDSSQVDTKATNHSQHDAGCPPSGAGSGSTSTCYRGAEESATGSSLLGRATVRSSLGSESLQVRRTGGEITGAQGGTVSGQRGTEEEQRSQTAVCPAAPSLHKKDSRDARPSGGSSSKKTGRPKGSKGRGLPVWLSWGSWFGRTSEVHKSGRDEPKSTAEARPTHVASTTETEAGSVENTAGFYGTGSVQTVASRDNGATVQSLASTTSEPEATETASVNAGLTRRAVSTASQGEAAEAGALGSGGGRGEYRQIVTGESRGSNNTIGERCGDNGACGRGGDYSELSKSTTSNRITLYDYLGGYPREVDWLGQKNIIDAANEASVMHIVLCSMMGGTIPNHRLNTLGRRRSRLRRGETGGDILLWKRRAERYLVKSGLSYTIVHPGGLSDEPGGRGLVVGVNDAIKSMPYKSVSREDVARVLVHSLTDPSYLNQSFDLLNEARQRRTFPPASQSNIETRKPVPPLEEETATLWTLMDRLKNLKYDYVRSGADQLLAAHEQAEESRIVFDNLIRGQQRHGPRTQSMRPGHGGRLS